MKSAAELRAIYKAAGVHVYTDSDVVLSANSAWLMLHTREEGDYRVSLPRKVRKITEITTEKTVPTVPARRAHFKIAAPP